MNLENRSLRKPQGLSMSAIFGNSGSESGGVMEVDIEELIPYAKNPFKLYDGERLEEMKGSIQRYGILQPILVRRKDSKYEILAGHNRYNVSKILSEEDEKFRKIPVRVLEDIDDDMAELIVSETNMQQRSLNDLKPSEKAFVISTYYNAEKKQGKRTDLIEKVNRIIGSEFTEEETSGMEKAKAEFNLSAVSIAKYNRINSLSKEIKDKLDNGMIDINTSYNLSFKNEEEQALINEYLNSNKIKLTLKKSQEIKKLPKVTVEDLNKIFSKRKDKSEESIDRIIKSYFPGKNKDEIIDLLKKILEEYAQKELP